MRRRSIVIVATVGLLLASLLISCSLFSGASQAATGETIFGNSSTGINTDPDNSKSVVGTQFKVGVDGSVSALRLYRTSRVTGGLTGKLAQGSTVLATVAFPAAGTGWQEAALSQPVNVTTGKTYTVFYTAPTGRYAVHSQYTWPKVSGDLTAVKGVYTFGSGVPTSVYQNENYFVDVVFNPTAAPTTTAPSSETTSASTTTMAPTTTAPTTSATVTTPAQPASWPDASNTGVPDNVTLTPTGNGSVCYLDQANQVYDAQRFNCDVVIQAANIKITRSFLNGRLISNSDNNPGASVLVEDSTIDGGQQETFPTVSYSNITLTRVEVVGGQHSVQCWAFCTVQDSWLHAQYLPRDSAGHVNAFISNGGNDFVLRHNTLDCSADPTASGGCTADASFFGDFGAISNVTLDGNFFKANHAGYCLQAGYNPGKKYPNPTNVKVTNNVFQRVGRDTNLCGIWGPYTAYDPNAPGAEWTNNKWDTGETIN